MRISTAHLFDQNLSAMLAQQTKLGKTQLQVSTGNRILSPSDDPAGSVQLLNLQREVSLSEQNMANADKAENKQMIQEGVLDSTTSILQRVRELAVQGLNATNTQADKQGIALEINQLNQQLLASANTRDSSGDYLFSGFKSATQPYANVNGDYQGDEGQRNIKVGEGVLIATNDPGNSVFEAPIIATTTSRSLSPVITANVANSGDGTVGISNFSGGSAVFSETFTFDGTNFVDGGGTIYPYTAPGPSSFNLTTPPMTVTFSDTPISGDALTVSNGLGTGQAEIIIDSGSGETFSPISLTYQAEIIANPLATPTPIVGVPAQYQISDGTNSVTVDYIAGMSIDLSELDPNFTSLTLNLTGSPEEGDQIVIERAQTGANQSMFKTINNFANALIANNIGPNNSPNNGDFLTNISASLGSVINARAKVGARLNSIEQQNQINEGVSINMQKALSQIKDLDYAEAVSRLSLQITGLQAAQQSFAKVQGLTLFNYL
jgi:flagellar hook-associated protein 3 FlgL